MMLLLPDSVGWGCGLALTFVILHTFASTLLFSYREALCQILSWA